MAYEFKKLSEVELLDSVPAGATVLAEVDGVIRRVPSDGLGGGGSSVVETDILAEQTLEFDDIGGGLYLSPDVPLVAQFIVGERYQVIWDESSYENVACAEENGEGTFLGNPSIGGSPDSDNGLPYVASTFTDDDGTVFVAFGTTEQGTSHTVRIYQVSEASGGVSSWNDLTDKPFYETLESAVVFPETDMTFEYSEDNGGFSVVGTPTSEQMTVWQADWSTMKVVWDGTEYICEPQDLQGIKFIGNGDLMLGSGDNGMPFVMMLGNMGADVYQIISLKDDPSAVSSATHTVSVSTDNLPRVAPLDSKFIEAVSWEKITDKPFGDLASGAVVLEESVTMGQNVFIKNLYLDGVIEGVNYTVYIGDVDTPDVYDIARYEGIGEYNRFSENTIIRFYDHNNTNIGYISTGYGGFIYIYDTETYPSGSKYNMKIVLAVDVVAQIDEKYLPVLEDGKIKSDYISDDYAHDYVIINSSTEGSAKKFKLTVDDSGTITATEITTE